MLIAEQNDLLCRVNGDAPMGALFKRYWLPACMADEVVAGGAPVRTTIVDTDIVVFKSPNGQLGAIYEYCPHRGVSLALARNEETGLRCLYHGWKFAADGRIVEMPTEPPGRKAKDHLCHDAYPAAESGGFIWVYLGPTEVMPKFQPMPWRSMSRTQSAIQASSFSPVSPNQIGAWWRSRNSRKARIDWSVVGFQYLWKA